MTVQFYTKNIYGNTLIYLVDSESSRSMLELIGQKTISKSQMAEFEKIGVTFDQVINPSEKKVNKPELTIRTTADYTKIYEEGGYTALLPEDMRWLDEHITADGRTIM